MADNLDIKCIMPRVFMTFMDYGWVINVSNIGYFVCRGNNKNYNKNSNNNNTYTQTNTTK